MTIFSKIIRGEVPSIMVAEDKYAYAFMDIFPLRPGHVLVIPKLEVDEIYELPDDDYVNLIRFAKIIAQAMRKAFNKRIGFSVIGLEVPHAHIHLVPIETANDINFNQAKIKMSQEELENMAMEIRREL